MGKWVVVFALVVSTGGHWFALQSVAWFRMAVNFAQTDPLDLALKKTFDGKHPCRICKTVEEGRKSEQKPPALKVELKFEFCASRQAVTVPMPPVLAKQLTIFDTSHSPRSESPPTPPPRLA